MLGGLDMFSVSKNMCSDERWQTSQIRMGSSFLHQIERQHVPMFVVKNSTNFGDPWSKS